MKDEVLKWSACAMGASVGLKVRLEDRARYFDRARDRTVILKFDCEPSRADIEVNCDKASFWNDNCHELISMELKRWLEDIGQLDWPKGKPPQVHIRPDGPGVFRIAGFTSQKPG